MRSIVGFHLDLRLTVAALLLSSGLIPAQEQPKTSFYDVQVSKEEVYKYSGLKFSGDYTSFESPSGYVALGKTEAGVTIVIVLGDGTLRIEAPEAGQEKFKTVFGNHPLRTSFKSVYMRLNPKEYDEVFSKLQLTKSPDDAVLARAKEIYDQRFLASYHAGPKAIFPPYRTRVMDFDTPDIGQIINEEGYWLILRKVSPYASVYPSRFVNPKGK
ncbi:MAG TPA: hypothetical protein VE398_15795 [Acidobacteriota bacterium]|nr:hypothetical protein [Acidobacteriota bacterium]